MGQQANKDQLKANAAAELKISADASLETRLRAVLKYFVNQMRESYNGTASFFEKDKPEFSKELRAAAELYHNQASEAIDLIKTGSFSMKDLKQVTTVLYVTNLSLRWTLEQQTTDYKKLLYTPSRKTGEEVEAALALIDSGKEDEGFNFLLNLVQNNRNHYPLLMIMGYIYLRKKKNLTFAMRYFEKAARTPAITQPAHFRNLALTFISSCHEIQGQEKNALNTLLHSVKEGTVESPMLFDISRLYGKLGNGEKSAEYFDKALKRRPEFMALMLTDQEFKRVDKMVQEKVQAKIEEHTEYFFELGREFTSIVTPMLEVIDEYDLRLFNEDLERTARVTRFNLAMIKKGYYSSCRQGILGFFRGAFPEIIDEITTALNQYALDLSGKIDDQNEENRKKFSSLKRIVVPSSLLAGGAMGYFSWDYLYDYLPFSLDFGEYILSVAIGAITSIIAFATLTSSEKSKIIGRDKITKAKKQAEKIAAIRKPLRDFFVEKIRPHIEARPLVDSDEVL